jgi:hypothetical protein
VGGPVHLGHLAEDGLEELVEDDLPVEAHDQVVDVGPPGQVNPCGRGEGVELHREPRSFL